MIVAMVADLVWEIDVICSGETATTEWLTLRKIRIINNKGS